MKNKLWLLCLPLLYVSCSDDEVITPTSTETQEVPVANVVCTIGKKIEDPYKIDNMRKAYRKLYAADSTIPKMEIQPTHKYLRFLPKNEAEYEILRSDTCIDLFSHPLDYVFTEDMSYYHDPSLPESSITYQYSVLPIDYTIPDVYYELIYECYFPEDNDEKSEELADVEDNAMVAYKACKSTSYHFSELLEREAYSITNSIVQHQTDTTRKKASRFQPSGTIMVYDTEKKANVPVPKAKVYYYSATRYKWAYTDENGKFKLDEHFLLSGHYEIHWETKYWDIRDGLKAQAFYCGPKQHSSWNKILTPQSNSQWQFATITRAAYRMYYGDNLGITRPIESRRCKISYRPNQESSCGGVGMFIGYVGNTDFVNIAANKADVDFLDELNNLGINAPDILVFNGACKYQRNESSSKLYGTVIHELGHYSHYVSLESTFGKSVFKMLRLAYTEAYATAIECALTLKEYNISEIGEITFRKRVEQDYNSKTKSRYKPCLVDLYDDYDQFDINGQDYHDYICNIPLKTIEQLVINNKNLDDIKERVKVMSTNYTISSSGTHPWVNNYGKTKVTSLMVKQYIVQVQNRSAIFPLK